MKILIVSWYFPPFNAIGGLRVGKLARFLAEQGHDLRIVAGNATGIPRTQKLEIAPDLVRHADWIAVNDLPKRIQSLRKRLSGQADAPAATIPDPSDCKRERKGVDKVLHALSDLYRHVMSTPDSWAGWAPFALKAARQSTAQWRPDIVFASGPPFTAFLVAARTARRLGVPWVAEYRDRWTEDPYFTVDWPDWRRRMITALENRLIATASGIVTVSEPWREHFARRFGKPVATVLNGFDPRDFPLVADPGPPLDPDCLTILYAGTIYPGRRDPTPLFRAMAAMGANGRRVRVRFLGSAPAHVMPLAEACGVADRVEVLPAVPYDQSVALQRRADALLLLQWDAPQEMGNVPAKLFEYLAVLRPIIGIGLEDGVPATIIRQRRAGIFSNDPSVLADRLLGWLAERDGHGRVPALPEAARQGFERDRQFAITETFLRRCLDPEASARSPESCERALT